MAPVGECPSNTAAALRARELVLAHGWNATAYQILNPGFEHWFSARGDAVVGLVRRHRVWVAAGAPVCAGDRLADVVAEFESEAAASGHRVCYFGAAGRINELLSERPRHSTVVLGAQPVWNPAGWPAIIERHASLRAQLHRALNKGVSVAEWPAERATGNADLNRCLAEWLSTRGLPPMHFLVEPRTLARLTDRRIFVAGSAGAPVGFVVASPVPARNGWLIEQFVRGRDAPNGTAELMIDAAVRALAADGAEYLTMGLSPLSRQGGAPGAAEPVWLPWLLHWLRAHGTRFYNFAGLEAFKTKFQPDRWEPIFAVSNEPRFSFGTLYAIAAAFTGRAPASAAAEGLARAVRQELRWLAEWRRSGEK